VEENGVGSQRFKISLTKSPVSELQFRCGLFYVSFDAFFDNSRSRKFRIANCGAERVADTAVGTAEGGSTCLVTHDAPRTGCIRATIHTETEKRPVMSISGLHFAHLRIPIETVPRLSEIVGGSSLFIKRDDQTGLAGGNKTIDLTLRPGAQSDLRDST
jgi:hypothetical protein